MKNYRIIKEVCGEAELFIVEKRGLFMFDWLYVDCESSLEEAEKTIEILKTRPKKPKVTRELICYK